MASKGADNTVSIHRPYTGIDQWMQWHVETSFSRHRSIPGDLLRDDVDPQAEMHMCLPKMFKNGAFDQRRRVAKGVPVVENPPKPCSTQHPKTIIRTRRTRTQESQDCKELMDSIVNFLEQDDDDTLDDDQKQATRLMEQSSRGLSLEDTTVRFDSIGELVATPSLIQRQREMMQEFKHARIVEEGAKNLLSGIDRSDTTVAMTFRWDPVAGFVDSDSNLLLNKEEKWSKWQTLSTSRDCRARYEDPVRALEYSRVNPVLKDMDRGRTIRLRCNNCRKQFKIVTNVPTLRCIFCSALSPMGLAKDL